MVLEQGASTTIPDPQSSNDQHWNEPSFWNGVPQSASVQQHWDGIDNPNSSAVADLPWIPAPPPTTDLLNWNGPSFWNEAQSASIQQHWEDIAVPNSSTVAELPLMANSQFAQQSAHHRLPINEAERQPWIEFDPLASSVDSR